ncbi:hypothetical protein HPB47_020764 [Ixodes persulcatus]|uniref:Uncharacterized protein n=1 Tax=Ixodes persulcatus TaxID=34615 RepID=A0AC60QEF6_IXOPE|nr:hypothetical protein HPB47_020764 [Ixodes persulcatus]
MFRTKRALWQQLADTVVGEFGGVVTADQAENKWKSLERAYKNAKSKNNKSTTFLQPCCWRREEWFRRKERPSVAPPSNQRAPAGTPSKRKRETALGSLLKVFANMEESRKQRHKDRMALLERLVTAIEKSAPAE